MSFIPKNAVWYIAQVVVEITVEGEPQNVVHINYLLVQAQSPAQAYESALRMGSQHETTYLNSDEKVVKIAFRGLRELNVVYDSLEDGAEIMYEEILGVSVEGVAALVRPKDRLAVFMPIERKTGPNYASEDIQREARALIKRGAPDPDG